MPLKEVALSVAEHVSPVAAAVGAANTLVRQEAGSWRADNTDVPGMVDVLAGVPAGARFTVIGAGGTARAAIAAASRMAAAAVTVVARRPEAIDELRPVAEAVGVAFTGADWSAAAELARADVVISTVPKGAADHLAAAVHWRPSTVLFDALYDPWPTPVAAAAAAAGCRIISGLDLLLAQAVSQWEQFTGVSPAPTAAMRQALFTARSH
jgi:shikimate dehydrogenase